MANNHFVQAVLSRADRWIKRIDPKARIDRFGIREVTDIQLLVPIYARGARRLIAVPMNHRLTTTRVLNTLLEALNRHIREGVSR